MDFEAIDDSILSKAMPFYSLSWKNRSFEFVLEVEIPVNNWYFLKLIAKLLNFLYI